MWIYCDLHGDLYLQWPQMKGAETCGEEAGFYVVCSVQLFVTGVVQ